MATWSLRLRPVWSLAPDVAGDLGDPALDGGVDVLVVGGEHERPAAQLPLHLVECGQQPATSLGVEQPAPAEAPDMGPGAGQVVEGQPPVDSARLTEYSMTTSAVPPPRRPCHSVIGRRAAGPSHRVPWTADQVATPRPHSRTKPSASCVPEGVGGVVGGQAVVVEAHRAAPADHPAAAGVEAQPDLAGHVPLGLER